MTLDSLVLAGLLLIALAAVAVGFLVVRLTPRSGAARQLGEGDFEAVLRHAATAAGAEREELYAAGVAAKHLLRLHEAATLFERLTAADPEDGEGWLELGLVNAYRGDLDRAEAAFEQAETWRADLLESITLHRAWLALTRGEIAEAKRRFEEVETPLENKLRSDLGAGEPLFVEWFLQAADLWAAAGDGERAAWARAQGAAAAPRSPLARRLAAGDRPPL